MAIRTSKTPCVAMYERARKRLVCFWCGFNIKAERFPRQRNWRRTCECAVTPPPTFVNPVTIASLATHQILAKLVNRILRYGGGRGVHVRTCRDAERRPVSDWPPPRSGHPACPLRCSATARVFSPASERPSSAAVP